MQEDLRHHKEMHEHYRARCDVQQKVRALPAILSEKLWFGMKHFYRPELINSNGPENSVELDPIKCLYETEYVPDLSEVRTLNHEIYERSMIFHKVCRGNFQK